MAARGIDPKIEALVDLGNAAFRAANLAGSQEVLHVLSWALGENFEERDAFEALGGERGESDLGERIRARVRGGFDFANEASCTCSGGYSPDRGLWHDSSHCPIHARTSTTRPEAAPSPTPEARTREQSDLGECIRTRAQVDPMLMEIRSSGVGSLADFAKDGIAPGHPLALRAVAAINELAERASS